MLHITNTQNFSTILKLTWKIIDKELNHGFFLNKNCKLPQRQIKIKITVGEITTL